MQGGTTFTFVTGGPAAALERARRAADGRNVVVSGGGSTARQYLAAGLLDELDIHLVPAFLEAGVRLFDSPALAGGTLEQTHVIEAPGVTHLRYHIPGNQATPLARPAALVPPPGSPPTNASGPAASRNTQINLIGTLEPTSEEAARNGGSASVLSNRPNYSERCSL